MPPELGLLQKLNQEIGELPEGPREDAQTLLHGFTAASARYCGAVTAQAFATRMPDGGDFEETRSWQRETEALDRSRRSAHEAVISDYQALVRFCRKHRRADLSIERQYPADSRRDIIGDLAGVVQKALVQANTLDRNLHTQLTGGLAGPRDDDEL